MRGMVAIVADPSSPFLDALLPVPSRQLAAHANAVTCVLAGRTGPLRLQCDGRRVDGDLLLVRPGVAHAVALAERGGDVLYLNGARQDESAYVHHTDPGGDGMHPWMLWQRDHLVAGIDPERYRPTRDNWGPLVVPDGHYFVLGDNRDESLDSRYWGFIDGAAIKGKAVVLYFSYDSHALGPLPFVKQVRWDRIGERLR